MKPKSIKIDREFRSLIPPLAADELQLLEEKLRSEGCRDPLVIWADKNILLDGHHRYQICKKHGIKFTTVAIELPDREAAADWIDANQLGRRNLKPDQFALVLGRRYERQRKQGERVDLTCGQNVHKSEPAKTAKKLAKQYGVNEKTVRRAGEFAKAVEKVKAVDPDIEQKISEGTAPPKSDIVKAAKRLDENPERVKKVQQGKMTLAQLYDRQKKDEAAKSSPTSAGGSVGADEVVIRAMEAAKAVVALGDDLDTVSANVRARFYSTLCQLSTMWKRLFPAPGTKSVAARSPDAGVPATAAHGA